MAKKDSTPSLMNTSIIKKFIMSITGIMLVLFLFFHMSMNVVAVISAEAYDMICEFLGANWYALVATLFLAAGFVIHIIYSLILTLQNQKARGKIRYEIEVRPKEVDWASKNMFVLGLIVVGFLFLHFIQFWYKMQFAELIGTQTGQFGPTEGSKYIELYFSQPLYVVVYLVWLGAIWFHLSHGFWSALHTLGWNNSIWLPRLQLIAKIVATIIVIGFAIVPITYYIQSL